MKKRILSIVLVVGILMLLGGCSKKEAVTADVFKSTMEDSGYTITDATDQFSKGSVDSLQIALKDKYQIEFYVVPSVDQAQSAYNKNKATFEKIKKSSPSSSYKSVELKNYSSYSMTSSKIYYVISRVDNTFIYLTVPVKYKNDINKIISKLGY